MMNTMRTGILMAALTAIFLFAGFMLGGITDRLGLPSLNPFTQEAAIWATLIAEAGIPLLLLFAASEQSLGIVANSEAYLARRGGLATGYAGGGWLYSDIFFLLGAGTPEHQGIVRRFVYSKMAEIDRSESKQPGRNTWCLGSGTLLFAGAVDPVGWELWRTDGSAERLTEEHRNAEKQGWEFEDLEIYIEDGDLVDFENFEDDVADHWVEVLSPGVGDYAALYQGLQDLDPCRGNSSFQVAFVDRANPSSLLLGALEGMKQAAPKADIQLMGHPNLASRDYLYRHYDPEVQASTILRPGEADAGVVAPVR